MNLFKVVLAMALMALVALMMWPYRPHHDHVKRKPGRVVHIPAITPRECLARNLYYETLMSSHTIPEARKELEAIMHVVFQRRTLGRKAGYPNTVCGVIYQHAAFSWTLKRSLRNKVPENKERYAYMLRMADDGLRGVFDYEWPSSNICIVSYKRADNKGVGRKPAIWFRTRMRPVTVIGSHQFYCPKPKVTGPRKKRA